MTPFQPELWIGILVTFLCLVIILQILIYYEKIQTQFPCWLYILAGLLEDGVSIPSQIEKKSAFRLIFGCWIIVGVLLSNCYNGLMITGLNSPLETNNWDLFQDWLCNLKDTNYTKDSIFGYQNSTSSPDSLNYHELVSYFERLDSVFQEEENISVNLFSLKGCAALLSFPKRDQFSTKVLSNRSPIICRIPQKPI